MREIEGGDLLTVADDMHCLRCHPCIAVFVEGAVSCHGCMRVAEPGPGDFTGFLKPIRVLLPVKD